MNNLKHYRTKTGMTQKELADRVGISHRTLQAYEQDGKPLEKAAAITVLHMAHILGCTMEELLCITPEAKDLKVEFTAPKKGEKMRETKNCIELILLMSGYDDLTSLEVKSVAGSPVHIISLDGSKVGRFYYNENRLVLSNGEGILLDKLDPAEGNVRIQRSGQVWEMHPKTKIKLFEALLKE